jgi:hypothetical protein
MERIPMQVMYDELRRYANIIADKEHETTEGVFIRFTTYEFEGMYYVVDLNPDKSDDYWRELYTATTRRSRGSIIVTREYYKIEESGKTVTFMDSKDASTVSKRISKEVYANYAKQRKEVLDKVITG